MRFKQIALTAEPDPTLYALSQDGYLYYLACRLEDIPDSYGLDEYGHKIQNRRAVRFWEALDYPVGDPALLPPQPEIRHLWTDEEVADMKAKGIISEEPPRENESGEDLNIPF
jgi:hypothetical protein